MTHEICQRKFGRVKGALVYMQAPANTTEQEIKMGTLKEISSSSGFLYNMSDIPPPPPHIALFKVASGFESSPCFTNRTLLNSAMFYESELFIPCSVLLMSPVRVLPYAFFFGPHVNRHILAFSADWLIKKRKRKARCDWFVYKAIEYVFLFTDW